MRDRVVQAALRLVIEPIFEWEFLVHSYGFRPERGCKDALREVCRLLRAGYTHVVDADMKAYYDSIPHSPLLADVGRYIADGRVLGLPEGFLKQDILEGLAPCGPRNRGVRRERLSVRCWPIFTYTLWMWLWPKQAWR